MIRQPEYTLTSLPNCPTKWDQLSMNMVGAAATLGRWYQWRDMRPFFIRHVTRVAKLAAIIGTTVL